MKYLNIITSIFVLLIVSCSAQKSINSFEVINYNAQTRGSMIKINVKEGKLNYKTYDNEKTYILSRDDIKELNNLVNKLNVNEIKNLKAPSNNRATDGALIAKIIFKIKDVEYTSSTFDAGNPPKELKKLENLLYNLAKLKE